jgi:solute carrier family 25 protein 44
VDAFRKILKYEGAGGLYKGFWINTFQIVSSVFYVTTYENVRHFMLANDFHDARIRALVAGGCASLVGQTFIVPCDVVSQHLMVLGQMETKQSRTAGGVNGVAGKTGANVNPLDLEYFKYKTKFDLTMAIGRRVYERDGLLGFYRGYWASLCTYVPTSALWWSFYQLYQG